MEPPQPQPQPVVPPARAAPDTSAGGCTPQPGFWLARLGQETRALLPVTLRALRMTIVLVVLAGVVFPLVLFTIGQLAFPVQANGSLVTDLQGHVIGSSLIGQQFTQPAYFHGRPSAV